MSFVDRLSKVQKKNSEGTEKRIVLHNEPQKLNAKITRQQTDFEKHHSDLKSILQYLECEKSVKLSTTDAKGENFRSQSVRPVQNINIDMKQNAGTRVALKSSAEKCPKPKIKASDELNLFQVRKQTFLQRNLKSSISKRLVNDPEQLLDLEKVADISKRTFFGATQSTQVEKNGIPNIGNTCYINAVLQCLFHLKDFNEGLHSFSNSSHYILNQYLDLFCAVSSKSSEKKNLSTLPLKKSISKMCSLFIDFHQEDAHEFLKELLETIHQELNRVKDRAPYRMLDPSRTKANLSVLSQEYWTYYKKFDDSYIYDALCGQVCNFVSCINCKHESVSFDNFLELSIPIVKGKSRLEDLLAEYFDEEVLTDYYFCANCKKSSKKSSKRLELWRNPNYLIIQLKRSQFGRKNTDNIQIPVRCLNMKPYMTKVEKQSRSTMYHLQATVEHRGVIEGGHYWAQVKDGLNWFSADDSDVRKNEKDQLIDMYENQGSSQAYILFYRCL